MSFAQGAPTQPLVLQGSNVFLYGSSTAGNAFTVQQLSAGNVASFVTSTGATGLIVNPSGQVGIGKTNPAYAMDITGDLNFTGTFRQNGTPYIGSQWTGTTTLYFVGNVGINTTSVANPLTVNGTVVATTFSGSGASLTSLPMGQATGTLAVANGGTGTTTSTGTGSVVLSANPTFTGTLVASSITASSSFTRTTGSTTTAFVAQGTGLASTDYNYILSGANDTANRLVIFVNGSTRTGDGGASNVTIRNDLGSLILGNPSYPTLIYGNVGIGTASPSYILDVNGQSRIGNPALITDASTVLRMTTTGGASYFQTGTALTGGSVGDTVFTGIFGTPELMRIKSTGNVGIGTASIGGGQAKLWSANDVTLVSGNYAGDVAAQIMAVGSTNPLKRLALMYDTTNNIGLVQAMIAGTGTSPLCLNAAGGNVGIGTASPVTNLDVAKTTASGTPAIEIRGAGGGPRLQVYGRNADAQAWMGLGTDMTSGPYEHAVYFPNANSGANGFLTFGSYNGTAYSEKMRITVGGNVGIGTASPVCNLHLWNSGTGGQIGIGQQNDSTPYMRIGMDSSYVQYICNNAYWAGSAYNYVSTGGYGGQATRIYQVSGVIGFDTASGGTNPISFTNRLFVANAGQVGVGTVSPQFLLNSAQDISLTTDIAPNTAQFAVTGATTNTKRMVFGYDTQTAGNGYGFIKAGNYNIAWTNIALQPNGGNVGIGITNPSYKLHVSAGDSSYAYFGPNTTWGAYLVVGAGVNQRTSGRAQIITTNGNLHMDSGTGQIIYLNYYSAGDGVGAEVRVYGPLNVTGDITAFYSDERLKTKTGVIENALDKVCSLNAFKYIHNEIAKQNGFEGDEVQVGLSAQEVQKILPEVVAHAPFDIGTEYDVGVGKSKTGQNYLTLKYERLVPLLVEALKEERAERLRLQDRLERLEKLLLKE